MFVGAFNAILALHGRPATLQRLGTTTLESDIRIAPSHYVMDFPGTEDIQVKGRLFIAAKASIKNLFDPPYIKRGDRLIDPELGTLSITEVREMYDFGGAIVGYRLKTE